MGAVAQCSVFYWVRGDIHAVLLFRWLRQQWWGTRFDFASAGECLNDWQRLANNLETSLRIRWQLCGSLL
jgi:hypothetical protein